MIRRIELYRVDYDTNEIQYEVIRPHNCYYELTSNDETLLFRDLDNAILHALENSYRIKNILTKDNK